MTVIPKIIIETLPAEVRLKGLENFERIGEENVSLLGHRRGGPVEIVLCRPKFVARCAAPADDHVPAVLRQCDRCGLPDARAATGHDRHLAISCPCHVFLPIYS